MNFNWLWLLIIVIIIGAVYGYFTNGKDGAVEGATTAGLGCIGILGQLAITIGSFYIMYLLAKWLFF
jgi:hypothetical protein